MFGYKARLEAIENAVKENNAIIEYVKFKVFQDEKCDIHSTLQRNLDQFQDNFNRLQVMMNEFKGLVAIVRGEAAVKRKAGRPKKVIKNDNI